MDNMMMDLFGRGEVPITVVDTFAITSTTRDNDSFHLEFKDENGKVHHMEFPDGYDLVSDIFTFFGFKIVEEFIDVSAHFGVHIVWGEAWERTKNLVIEVVD